jgi:hypothetical protein
MDGWVASWIDGAEQFQRAAPLSRSLGFFATLAPLDIQKNAYTIS